MKLAIALSLALAVPAQSWAQAAEADWDLVRDANRKITGASATFSAGLMIGARCNDGGYEAFIAGLPATEERTQRILRIAFGDDELVDQRWSVGQDPTVAVSDLPAPFARDLRQGGPLTLVVPGAGGDGRNLRYQLTLPASEAAIDATLTACDRPTVDPRDVELDALPEEGVPIGITWRERPRPAYPSPIKYARGFAVVTCMSQPDGALRDCEVETEHPRDGGFGEATLRPTRRARLQVVDTPGVQVPPRMIAFRGHYVLEGYDTAEDRTARREQRDRDRNNRSRPTS